ncbi:unnamed protein product [Brassica rapa subsp. trilocularis]
MKRKMAWWITWFPSSAKDMFSGKNIFKDGFESRHLILNED